MPTPTSIKTASLDTVPLEWADEILCCLDSDEEEAKELDHRVAMSKLWKLSLDLNLQLLQSSHDITPCETGNPQTATGPTCSIDGREWCNDDEKQSRISRHGILESFEPSIHVKLCIVVFLCIELSVLCSRLWLY